MSSDLALKLPLEIEDIKAILPHRYPFLLVDRVLEFETDKRIVGIKNVSANERYFIAGPGGVPILPATILTEAMAQIGAVLVLAKPENRSRPLPQACACRRLRRAGGQRCASAQQDGHAPGAGARRRQDRRRRSHDVCPG